MQKKDDKAAVKGNPLLINLDQCLAFHLNEMMEKKDADADEKKALLPKSERPKVCGATTQTRQ